MGDRRTPVSDAELVALTQDGNLHAFNRLAERWGTSLYRFACRVLGNPEDARDVSQEALVKAYVNIRRLRDPDKFRPWVHHIALNLCRDRQRSRHARVTTESYAEGEPGEVHIVRRGRSPAAPDQEAHRAGLGGILEQVLDELPPEQREAIVLREYEGFTSPEIAEITGVPSATVRTRIFYGLKTVRRKLGERGVTDAGMA
jgi:RNA polymerase sigma-70 factor (ECF subfamily)